jgi:WD40 repeat protein
VHKSPATRWAFSPDGSRFATVSVRPQRETGSLVTVWNLGDAREVSQFTTPQAVSHIEFSPDSNLLAWGGSVTGLMGASVRVHRCSDGQPTTPFLAHRGDIKDIEFSPDSRLIATGSSDGSARLWDVAQARLTGPEIPHPHHVASIGFSRDGLRFVTLTAGASPAMRVWETASAASLTPPMRVSKGSWFCHFTDDGSALISAGDTFVRWPLADGKRTPEDLIAEAELLSGLRYDEVNGHQRITAAEFRALREAMKSK